MALTENQRCADKIFSRDFRDRHLIKILTMEKKNIFPSRLAVPDVFCFIVAYVILNVILTADDVIMCTDRFGVSFQPFP